MSASSLADSIMFLGFAMLIVQRGSLAVRVYRPVRAAAPAGESRTTGAPV